MIITTETAYLNPNWERVLTGYEDSDYTVFRQVGMKERSTFWLHIHDAEWTGVFLTENQFVRTIATWEQLGMLQEAMFGELEEA